MLIDKLEEITPRLPEYPPLSSFKVITGINQARYNFRNGTILSENIYSTHDVAIAKTFIPKGTIIEPHAHAVSDEWVIVIEGSLKMFSEDNEQLLNKHDSIMVIANKPHHAIAVEDTTIIAITVPKDDGWPN